LHIYCIDILKLSPVAENRTIQGKALKHALPIQGKKNQKPKTNLKGKRKMKKINKKIEVKAIEEKVNTVEEIVNPLWDSLWKDIQEEKEYPSHWSNLYQEAKKQEEVKSVQKERKPCQYTTKVVNHLNHGTGTQSAMIDTLLLQGVYTKTGIAKELIRSGKSNRDEKTTINRINRHLNHVVKEHGYIILKGENKTLKMVKA
jgi:hypothetical protein